MKEINAFTEAQMLIRKPAPVVFNAFIDPAVTTNFWFSKSSGRLDEGKKVKWEWEMYNVSAEVNVISIQPDKKLIIDWGEPQRRVEFDFEAISPDTTYVVVKETGYTETGDELLAIIRDSIGGFTTVLDGLKAWLEHGINLNLIRDKFAKEKQ